MAPALSYRQKNSAIRPKNYRFSDSFAISVSGAQP
jgi:hypothetical protein